MRAFLFAPICPPAEQAQEPLPPLAVGLTPRSQTRFPGNVPQNWTLDFRSIILSEENP